MHDFTSLLGSLPGLRPKQTACVLIRVPIGNSMLKFRITWGEFNKRCIYKGGGKALENLRNGAVLWASNSRAIPFPKPEQTRRSGCQSPEEKALPCGEGSRRETDFRLRDTSLFPPSDLPGFPRTTPNWKPLLGQILCVLILMSRHYLWKLSPRLARKIVAQKS